MPRVAKPTRGLGITDTIGHQEAGCEYRVQTIKGETCMEREALSKRASERSSGKREGNMQYGRETQLVRVLTIGCQSPTASERAGGGGGQLP